MSGIQSALRRSFTDENEDEMFTIRAAFLMLMGISFIAPKGMQTQLFEPDGSRSPTYGMVDVTGQALKEIKTNIVYDPFVNKEKAENVPIFGEAVLSVHE
jgi:hypothetical protein